MSTSTDNVANKSIDLGEGAKATPNGDGTYTVTGAGDSDGVYTQTDANTPGAIPINGVEGDLASFNGTYWIKQ